MAVINVKIISDVVCPFCYLGKKRLEKAVDVYRKTVPGGADDRIRVTWLPFYLDPTAPKKGVPVRERMAQKFGADRVDALNARMRALGAAEGITFTHEGKTGNTRDAHRLIQLAKAKAAAAGETCDVGSVGSGGSGGGGIVDRLVSSLFRAYFEEGADITSHEALVAAAARAGLDADEAKAWLGDGRDRGGAEVDAEVSEAFARSVHGVPHFVLNDAVEVSGAQDVPTFVRELARARGQGQAQ